MNVVMGLAVKHIAQFSGMQVCCRSYKHFLACVLPFTAQLHHGTSCHQQQQQQQQQQSLQSGTAAPQHTAHDNSYLNDTGDLTFFDEPLELEQRSVLSLSIPPAANSSSSHPSNLDGQSCLPTEARKLSVLEQGSFVHEQMLQSRGKVRTSWPVA
jgi:hypothetical protein